jgi:hypothetical protein
MLSPEKSEMLSREKHCEFLSANVRHRTDALMSWFKLFVQMYGAIVGGALVLRLQYKGEITAKFIILSDVLAGLVAVASIGMVYDAHRAWKGHRKKLTEVAGKDESGNDVIPPPNLRKTAITFGIMLGVMIGSLILFLLFNPLQM